MEVFLLHVYISFWNRRRWDEQAKLSYCIVYIIILFCYYIQYINEMFSVHVCITINPYLLLTVNQLQSMIESCGWYVHLCCLFFLFSLKNENSLEWRICMCILHEHCILEKYIRSNGIYSPAKYTLTRRSKKNNNNRAKQLEILFIPCLEQTQNDEMLSSYDKRKKKLNAKNFNEKSTWN